MLYSKHGYTYTRGVPEITTTTSLSPRNFFKGRQDQASAMCNIPSTRMHLRAYPKHTRNIASHWPQHLSRAELLSVGNGTRQRAAAVSLIIGSTMLDQGQLKSRQAVKQLLGSVSLLGMPSKSAQIAVPAMRAGLATCSKWHAAA